MCSCICVCVRILICVAVVCVFALCISHVLSEMSGRLNSNCIALRQELL